MGNVPHKVLWLTPFIGLGWIVSLEVIAENPVAPLLRVEPREVVFHSMEDQPTVRVFLGGTLLDQARIEYAGIEGPYSRMFFVERPPQQPGTIILKANPSQLEVGTYNLRIRAAGQLAEVTVRAPLDTLRSIIDIESDLQKTTPEDIKLQYGLARFFGKEELSIDLPQQCYLGFILNLSLPRYTDRFYYWYLNGEPVLTGLGESVLRLPFQQTGFHTIRLEVKKENVPTVTWEGSLNVVREPQLNQTLPLGKSITLQGPEGFKNFEWRIDDQTVSSEKTYQFRPTTVGTFTITCRATTPVNEDSAYALREITWVVESVPVNTP